MAYVSRRSFGGLVMQGEPSGLVRQRIPTPIHLLGQATGKWVTQ